MCSLTKQSLTPIRLDFQSVERVLVVAEDEDRFITTSKEAALACKQAERFKEWRDEFAEFLASIHRWCGGQSEVVSDAYLGVGEEGLKVFLVTKGEEYRFDFEDRVTELDVVLAEQFKHCPATILQIPATPPEALTSFFSTESALQVYGHRR